MDITQLLIMSCCIKKRLLPLGRFTFVYFDCGFLWFLSWNCFVPGKPLNPFLVNMWTAVSPSSSILFRQPLTLLLACFIGSSLLLLYKDLSVLKSACLTATEMPKFSDARSLLFLLNTVSILSPNSHLLFLWME